MKLYVNWYEIICELGMKLYVKLGINYMKLGINYMKLGINYMKLGINYM